MIRISDLQIFFFFSSRRRHTRFDCDWSSDVCSSDLSSICPARTLRATPRGKCAETRVASNGMATDLRKASWKIVINAPVSTSRRRSEEHTSELQSQSNLVCRLLLEKTNTPPIS